MTVTPKFDPIFPAHAIERCGITIAFRELVPQKVFDRLITRATLVAGKKGFQRSPGGEIGITVDFATGKFGPALRGGQSQPQSFSLPDQSASLFLAPSMIIWQNSRYVRWSPFVGQFQEIASSVISEFLDLVSLGSVKIEYWDRFNWTGTWDDFDAMQLIRPNAQAVADDWPKWNRQWHSHAGWFEAVDECRRLTNINVDVVDVTGKPTVGIFTMMQDEPNVPGYGTIDVKYLDQKYLFERLEVLHLALKSVLRSILQDAMIDRISLNSEADT
jgi:uncharacterized protein (TIGR04255 family)